MKLFTFLALRPVQKIALTFSLILLFASPLFAQRGWNHNGGDSASFKHRPPHRPNDTVLAHRINDSIFIHCRFDTAFANKLNQWNDTVYFHHHFDTAFAGHFHNRFDSIRRSKFDSALAHYFTHRFDTICAQHNWNDTISHDTIWRHHWNDTTIIRHHRDYVIFLHHVNFGNGTKTIESDVIATGSANTTVTIPVTVTIYPNPISESAVLHIANASEALNFRLFAVTGQVVMNMGNLSNGDVELNRNNLPAGMYFYQVLNSNSVVSTGKLVIQ